jgi:hypothetical protein
MNFRVLCGVYPARYSSEKETSRVPIIDREWSSHPEHDAFDNHSGNNNVETIDSDYSASTAGACASHRH